MEMERLLDTIRSTVKYGGYLDCTTLGLSKAMELCGMDEMWVNAAKHGLYRAWSEDIRNAEGFWIDKKVPGGLVFNKAALEKNRDILVRFAGESGVASMLGFLEESDRQISTWNSLIKAYRKCTRSQLQEWDGNLGREPQSEERDIELCIIHAEMEHRKIFNRVWGLIRRLSLKIKDGIQCRVVAAYIRP